MTYSEMQTHTALLLGTTIQASQQLVTEARAKFAIARAMEWAYTEARLKRRTATMTAVDEQAEYTFPYDLFRIVNVDYDGAMIDHVDLIVLQDDENEEWRQADPGTVQSWAMYGGSSIILYKAPDAPSSVDIELDAYCVPFNIGDGITSITQSGPAATVTVVTNAAHNLQVGNSVTISGSDVSAANAAWTVVTRPSTTSFTFANTTITTTLTDCELYYTGGLLPLVETTDVPAFNPRYHELIPLRAAVRIAETWMSSDERARAGYEGLVKQQNELLIGLKGSGVVL